MEWYGDLFIHFCTPTKCFDEDVVWFVLIVVVYLYLLSTPSSSTVSVSGSTPMKQQIKVPTHNFIILIFDSHKSLVQYLPPSAHVSAVVLRIVSDFNLSTYYTNNNTYNMYIDWYGIGNWFLIVIIASFKIMTRNGRITTAISTNKTFICNCWVLHHVANSVKPVNSLGTCSNTASHYKHIFDYSMYCTLFPCSIERS